VLGGKGKDGVWKRVDLGQGVNGKVPWKCSDKGSVCRVFLLN
jgi:hypothetical protein